MKLTKQYIKEIIKEELTGLLEASTYSDEEKKRRRSTVEKEFGIADPIQQDDMADIVDTVVASNNPNDLKLKLSTLPKTTLLKLRTSARYRDKVNKSLPDT